MNAITYSSIRLNDSNLDLYNVNTTVTGISYVVLTFNEERCIKRCLESIAFGLTEEDEVIIVDTGSTDNTLQIVEEFIRDSRKSIRLYCEIWENDFSQIRNAAIEKCRKDWVFMIDADEYLEDGCVPNIYKYINLVDKMKHDIAICPIIRNVNGMHDLKSVKRVFPRRENIKYKYNVHEDIFVNRDRMIDWISVNDIVLYHDGYQDSIMTSKKKKERNVDLINKVLDVEEENGRFWYYLSRDGKGVIPRVEEKYAIEKALKYLDKEKDKGYYVGTIYNYVEYCLEEFNNDEALKLLSDNKQYIESSSDQIYWRVLIKYTEIQKNIIDMLMQIYSFSSSEEDNGSLINTNNYHLDYLAMLLFKAIGQYDKSISICKKLETVKYTSLKKEYGALISLFKGED